MLALATCALGTCANPRRSSSSFLAVRRLYWSLIALIDFCCLLFCSDLAYFSDLNVLTNFLAKLYL